MQFEDLHVGPAPQLGAEVFARRRARLADALDGTPLVVATHPEMTYSNDVHARFRPHSDFWYLTGFDEPGAMLVLDTDGTSTLLLRPRKREAEIWTGRRLGVERAVDASGVDRAADIDEAPARFKALAGDTCKWIGGNDSAVREMVANAGISGDEGCSELTRMRIIKDADEVVMLRRAAEVGSAAMDEAASLVKPGRPEYEIEAALLASYRRAGSTGPGYPPIVGAGGNAAVLHYIDNRGSIDEGDLVLIDAGCEWGYYNSDITRTYAAGEPSTRAVELHALVLAAQQAALAKVCVGEAFTAPHEAARDTLAQGLLDMGLIDDAEQVARHFMHGTSHFLGLDVHDVGAYKDDGGEPIRLEAGMVLTVEPGLYFNPDYAALPKGMSPLGIRIEDDVVVTADGPGVLSSSPRELAPHNA